MFGKDIVVVERENLVLVDTETGEMIENLLTLPEPMARVQMCQGHVIAIPYYDSQGPRSHGHGLYAITVDIKTGQMHEYPHPHPIEEIRGLDDYRFLTWDSKKVVRIWNVVTCELIETFINHCSDLSVCGKQIVFGGKRTSHVHIVGV